MPCLVNRTVTTLWQEKISLTNDLISNVKEKARTISSSPSNPTLKLTLLLLRNPWDREVSPGKCWHCNTTLFAMPSEWRACLMNKTSFHLCKTQQFSSSTVPQSIWMMGKILRSTCILQMLYPEVSVNCSRLAITADFQMCLIYEQ